ncbi:hypothetical protein [Herpetosiphon gulosus]|uniref:Fungal lipase-like domain-containing protein n=1 Tax=Herpetosiphon gulosus TaxID=1973496 RepID=A0ABP9X7A3_9CHLR
MSSIVSASPDDLQRYSEEASALNQHLHSEANRLAYSLDRFAATCREYRTGVDSALADALHAHANRVQEMDSWVGQVGSNIARAGSEGSLGQWTWKPSAPFSKAMIGAVGGAILGLKAIDHQNGRTGIINRPPPATFEASKLRPVLVMAGVVGAAIGLPYKQHFFGEWIQQQARKRLLAIGRWVTDARTLMAPMWQYLKEFKNILAFAGAKPTSFSASHSHAATTATQTIQTTTKQSSLLSRAINRSEQLVKQGARFTINTTKQIVQGTQHWIKSQARLIKQFATKLGNAFKITLNLIGTSAKTLFKVAKSLGKLTLQATKTAFRWLGKATYYAAIQTGKFVWQVKKQVMLGWDVIKQGAISAWNTTKRYTSIALNWLKEKSIWAWDLFVQINYQALAELLLFVLPAIESFFYNYNKRNLFFLTNMPINSNLLIMNLLIGALLLTILVTSIDTKFRPDKRNHNDQDFILSAIFRRFIEIPDKALSQAKKYTLFKQLDETLAQVQIAMNKGTNIREYGKLDNVIPFGEEQASDKYGRYSPDILVKGNNQLISPYQSYGSNGILYSEQLSLALVNQKMIDGKPTMVYAYGTNGLNPDTAGSGTYATTLAVEQTAQGVREGNKYYETIRQKFLDSIENDIPPGSEINMTGHSMGAGTNMLLLNDPTVIDALRKRNIKVASVVNLEMVRPIGSETLKDPYFSDTVIHDYVDPEDSFATGRGAGHAPTVTNGTAAKNHTILNVDEPDSLKDEDNPLESHQAKKKIYRDNQGNPYFLPFEIDPAHTKLIKRYGQEHPNYRKPVLIDHSTPQDRPQIQGGPAYA